jgi:hypothetical protein
MVKRDDQTRHFSDQTRRCAHHPRAQRHDRTRSTQRPNATVPASSCSLESSHRDRTCPIAYDRTRRAFDQLFVTHYTNGCLIRRAGSARDTPIMPRPRLVQRLVTPLTSFTSVSLPLAQWKIDVSLPQKRRIPSRKLGGRERGTQTPLYRSNSTAFANVPTPTSVHHLVHVC